MAQVRFLTDEDVYGATSVALRKAEYDAVSTPEAGRLGETDESQLQWACDQGRVLVTFNVAHFANLHTQWVKRGRNHAGIVVSSQRPIGDLLRQQSPETIAGTPVVSVDDLDSGNRTHADGTLEPLAFPRSDVLIYRLENRSRVIVRPSGTEPKVKCYYEVVQDIGSEDFYKARQKAETSLADLISAHQSALAELTTL